MEEPQDTEEIGGGTGICVSGGGLRAASFGLGALQALQERCGLLRGPKAARYLSAVSGGSYIAGAYTLANCGDKIQVEGGGTGSTPRSADPPFGLDSPEAEHLRRHCRYMVEEGGVLFSAVLLVLIVLNLFAIVLFVGFVGYYLGMIAAGISLVGFDPQPWLQWVLAATFVGAVAYGVKQIDLPDGRRSPLSRVLSIPLALLGIVGVLPFVQRLEAIAPLANPQWLLDHAAPVLAVIGAIAATVAITALLGLWFRHFALLQLLRRVGTALLARWLVVVAGVLLVSWITVWMFGVYTGDPEPWEAALAVTVFVLGFFLPSSIVSRASPHFIYRDRLVRCFSILRHRDEKQGISARRPRSPKEIKLSELKPPGPGRPNSFPELLICAAINVSDVGATPAGSNVLSLVITPEKVEVPEVRGACIPTEELERLERPQTVIRGWGPALNLASAVAMTGAAISPAMGKRTRADLRALFALFDVRLGVWLPNPLHPEVRKQIKEKLREKAKPKERRVSVGMGGLLREIFGLHSERAHEIYVTDGGHYDNLGLVELLRRQCDEIWCIDASGDKPGRATALSEALLTASGELGVYVDIDLDVFARVPESPLGAPVLKSSYVAGWVRYPNGMSGKLHVVKLGITENTPSALREYRRTDRRFPHHSTINQIYRAERFDAYRELGWASTHQALDAAGHPRTLLSAPSPLPASDGRFPAQVG